MVITWLKNYAKFLENHYIFAFINIFLAIVGILSFFGIDAYTLIYEASHPVYIIKARVELANPENYTIFLDDDESFHRFQLFDVCGDMIHIEVLSPKSFPKLKESNNDIFNFGAGNLTYSISIKTSRNTGDIPIQVYSERTDYKLLSKSGSVTEISHSEHIAGKYEQRFDANLDHRKKNHEALFSILTEKDEKIYINCGDKFCYVYEMKYIFSDIPPYLKRIGLNNKTNDRIDNILVELPKRNFTAINVYQLDKNNKYVKISTDIDTNNSIDFKGANCVKDGKVYYTPLLD